MRYIRECNKNPEPLKWTFDDPTRHITADSPDSVDYGQTHDVKSLYVAGASLLPASIGYNPSETVYALASYISDHIVKAHA
jgi:choline dehydrogenase-like flavoprotein